MSAAITTPSGHTLAYRETGGGAPLILVHGSPGEGRAWSRVVPHLGDRYRIVMPDLPGYGASDPLPDDTSATAHTAAMAAGVAALIRSCDAPVHLCGHSYGGNVALHAALMESDRVQRLTLLEPVFFRALALSGDTTTLDPAARFFSAYADRVTGGQPEAVSEMIEFWFGAGSYDQLPPATRSYLQSAAAKNGADVRAAWSEQISVAQLAGFPNPTRIAYGAASPPVAPAIAKALAGLMPRASIHAIPDAGHGMLDSHPRAVADVILSTR